MKTLSPLILSLLFFSVLRIWRTRNITFDDFDKRATIPLRGLLAIFVVVGHIDTATSCRSSLLSWLHWSTPAVSVFLFMSGYGYERSFLRKGGAYLKEFISRTAIKLFLPFFIAAFVYCGYLFCVEGIVDIGKFVCGLKSGSILFLPHSWYVIELFLLAIIFRVICACRHSLFLAFLIAGVGYAIFRFALGWGTWWWFSILAFPIGMAYSRKEVGLKSFIRAYPVQYYSALAISYLLMVIITCLVPAHTPFLHEMSYLALGPIVVALHYIGLRVPALFNGIGIISYEVYLTHGIFEEMLKGVWESPYVFLFCVLGATCILSIALHYLCVIVPKRRGS